MTIFQILCRTLLGTGALASSAMASVPADLSKAPVLPLCTMQMQEIGKVVAARDAGVPKSVYLERNRTGPAGLALPEKLIDGVFAHGRLHRAAAEAYAMWSCHADGHGHAPLALESVHGDLTSCFSRPGDPCAILMRNHIVGVKHDWMEGAVFRFPPDLQAVRNLPGNQVPASRRVTHAPIAGSCAMPVYPKKSILNEEAGTVSLNLQIDDQGAVLDVKILKSSGFDRLDQAVLASFTLCKFTPLLKQGKPVAGSIETGWVFTLD